MYFTAVTSDAADAVQLLSAQISVEKRIINMIMFHVWIHGAAPPPPHTHFGSDCFSVMKTCLWPKSIAVVLM